MVSLENRTEAKGLEELTKDELYELKQAGFSDAQIAWLVSKSGTKVQMSRFVPRLMLGLKASLKWLTLVPQSFLQTPYYYSAYEGENESVVSDRKKVIILGSGPNWIGQGIEFDYSCTCRFSHKRNGPRSNYD